MTLSDGQLAALRNLSEKKAGGDVGYISIADARTLTDLGLAERNRAGWQITVDGEVALRAHAAGAQNDEAHAQDSSEP